MANATRPSFWEKYEAPKTNYLTEAERYALVESGTLFDIIGVEEDPNGKFGAAWIFTLRMPEGDDRRMSLTRNSARDMIVRQMQGFFHAYPNESIPSYLDKVRTAAGQEAYVFVNPDDDTMRAEAGTDGLPNNELPW